MQFTHDVVIVGGGIIGSSLACALAQQTSLTIALLEASPNFPAWSFDHNHHRVSAINLASKHFFQSINCWDAIQKKRVSPFTQIEVWDEHQNKIDFNSADIAELVLGFIVENNVIQSVLMDQIKQNSRIDYIAPMHLTHFQEDHDGITLESTEKKWKAPLVIAADGMHSWLRQKANIDIKQKNYHQEAIVANVKTEQSHQKTARQIFLKTGPLAFLPLLDSNTSSIVWSLPKELARTYLTLTDQAFKQTLSDAFSFVFGEMLEVGERYTFSLYQQQAKRYVKPHVALVGDAAHTVHPLAGQGLNMGLKDVVRLAHVIVNAINKQKHFYDFYELRAYERQSKAQNFTYLCAIDGLNTLFEKDHHMILGMRTLGLKTLNRVSYLKNKLMRFATGD